MNSSRAKDCSAQTSVSYGYGARERMLTHGSACLDTPELVSCLLGLPVAEAGVLLESLGDLRNLSVGELRAVLSPMRAAALLAAVELGRRVFVAPSEERPVVDAPEKAHAVLHEIAFSDVEHFAVLLLDIKHRLISKEIVSRGTLDETFAYPRDIFRPAIRQNAANVMVAHNHPSGMTEPSPQDLSLTVQLIECGRTLQIPVLDHVILGHGQFNSLRRTTALWAR